MKRGEEWGEQENHLLHWLGAGGIAKGDVRRLGTRVPWHLGAFSTGEARKVSWPFVSKVPFANHGLFSLASDLLP